MTTLYSVTHQDMIDHCLQLREFNPEKYELADRLLYLIRSDQKHDVAEMERIIASQDEVITENEATIARQKAKIKKLKKMKKKFIICEQKLIETQAALDDISEQMQEG